MDLLSYSPPPISESITIYAHQVRVPVDTSDRSDNAAKLFKVIRRMYDTSGRDGTFHDFTRIVLAVLNRHFDGDGPYMEAIKGLPRKALDIACEGWAILVNHFWIEGCFYDILGDVYMQVRSDWAGKSMGQYFTPWHVCVMMANQALDADEQRLLEGPEVGVHDPACGSGAMLLAFKAAVCDRFGTDDPRRYLRHVRLYGQDIDQVCVEMARIQTMMSDERFMTNFMLAGPREVHS